MKRFTFLPFLAALLVTGSVLAWSSVNYFARPHVVAGGGLAASSSQYAVAFTAGQPNIGMSDSADYALCRGFWCGVATQSAAADPDGDGLSNAWEWNIGTDPNNRDTDLDGIPDGDEDADGDGLTHLDEITRGTDPLVWDSDGDGLGDACDTDDDNDSRGQAKIAVVGSCQTAGTALPIFRDCIELFVGTNPLDACADTTKANDEAVDKVPADLNDDRKVNSTDVTLMKQAVKAGGQGKYDKRYDLDASGQVDNADLAIVNDFVKTTGGKACS